MLMSVISCQNQSSKEKSTVKNNSNFFQINYESLLKNRKVVHLSEIASDVEYIPLETNDDCVIGNYPQYFFTDSLILVKNHDHVLKFTLDGKFLARIGTSGRGPGEINSIRTMSVLPERHLIVIQNNSESKLLYFSFDGSLIKSSTIPHIENLKVLKDGNFLGYESGLAKYNFLILTEKGDTLSTVYNKNNFTSNNPQSLALKYELFEPFYILDSQIHFKSLYNDTVYHTLSNSIVPDYFINMGKYKLPSELIPERVFLDPANMQVFSKNADKYYYCNVFESVGSVFLSTANFKSWDITHLVYDKNTRNGYMLIDEGKNSAEIINDWDGGLNFWPEGNLENNKIYMPVSVIKIKSMLSESKPDLNTNMDKNKKLIELVSKLDDTGNPIIMIVSLKN